MPNTRKSADIVQHYVEGRAGPMPRVETAIDVHITGGLARVAVKRSFHNHEVANVEASMTFPMPVHATLFALTAAIDGRDFTARARPREQARAVYEEAIDQGRTAVLHEELLRGVHLLSIAHLAPGASVVATGSWTMPLAQHGFLRIPTTVGQVYGASPLRPGEDLVHGAARSTAILTLTCDDAPAQILEAGKAVAEAQTLVRLVPLDAPIDLAVPAWSTRPLHGRAADGRTVTLNVSPLQPNAGELDVALLIDRSGSMSSSTAPGSTAKHAAVIAGLQAALADMRDCDRCDVWEFSDTPTHVAGNLAEALPRLAPPGGGTEIGRAISTVFRHSTCPAVIVLTDGKTHALDVQDLASAGRRVHVVLIGEDSLEANIGHLAALTGGELLVADGPDTIGALSLIFAAARSPAIPAQPIAAVPEAVTAAIGGMRVGAVWSANPSLDDQAALDTAGLSRAVAAFAASLAIPHMERSAATELAVREGLVCHLTSLVLTDDRAGPRRGIPQPRHVPLPELRAMRPHYACSAALPAPSAGLFGPVEPPAPAASAAPVIPPLLRDAAQQIDWERDPDALARGVLTGLDASVALAIRHAARQRAVRDLAATLGIEAVVLVIGLLAFLAPVSRSADRIARRTLKHCDAAAISTCCIALGVIDLPSRQA